MLIRLMRLSTQEPFLQNINIEDKGNYMLKRRSLRNQSKTQGKPATGILTTPPISGKAYRSINRHGVPATMADGKTGSVRILPRQADSLTLRKATLDYYVHKTILPGMNKLLSKIADKIAAGGRDINSAILGDTGNYARIVADLEAIREELYQVSKEVETITTK